MIRMPKINIALSYKHKVYTLLAVSIIAMITIPAVLISALQTINSFFERERLEFLPIIQVHTNFPIKVIEREPQQIIYPVVTYGSKDIAEVASTKEDKERIIKEAEFGTIIAKIWVLESSKGEAKGHNKYCEALGMTNEFGYDAISRTCFHTFGESVKVVNAWVKNELKTKSLSQALCKYNLGLETSSCVYLANYEKL